MGRRRGNGRSGKYSVSLYPVDLEILAEVQEREMLNSLSGALQFVVRRWAREQDAKRETEAAVV